MNKKPVYVFLAAVLSIIVPVPARFAYGLFCLLSVIVIMLLGSGAKVLLSKLNLQELKNPLLLIIIVGITIICKQLTALYSPVIALTIGFTIYLAPLSSFLTGYMFSDDDQYESNVFLHNIISCGIFTLVSLFIIILRELMAYGTFSLPARDGIIVYETFIKKIGLYSFFWASIPGAFLMLGIILAVSAFVHRKINIVRRKEQCL